LCMGTDRGRRKGRSGDKGTERRGQQLIHLASRMKRSIDKNQSVII
jgi:hypothetical protein